MTKKPKHELELDDKEQSERFIETAMKIDTDQSGKSFNNALNKIVPPDKKGSKRHKAIS